MGGSEGTHELVARAVAREPTALAELVRTVGPVVRGRVAKALARRRGHGRDVAQELDDLTQEVFLALFDDDARALRAWDPARSPLGGFVALLTDHQVCAIFRSGRRRPWSDALEAMPDVDDAGRPPDGEAVRAASPEARLASAEALDRLLDLLRAELTPKGFDLFVRLYVEDQSVETVSQALGLTADAVYAWRSRLGKVVARLEREVLDPPSSPRLVSDPAVSSRTSRVEGSSRT